MRTRPTAVTTAAALLLLLPWLLAAPPAAARNGPPEHRVYALQGGTARVPVPTGPADRLWRVEDETGRPVRDWAPADPDGAVRVPQGGWFRLLGRTGAAGGSGIGDMRAILTCGAVGLLVS